MYTALLGAIRMIIEMVIVVRRFLGVMMLRQTHIGMSMEIIPHAYVKWAGIWKKDETWVSSWLPK
jgi:hypothetical protein